MRKFLLVVLCMLPLGVMAEVVYKDGSYWTVTSVDTKPGHYDDYLADLNNAWRKSLEQQKKDGKVKSYRIFSNTHARHGEPNLWLMVEWTSAGAVLDTPREYWDEESKKLFGSVEGGNEANIKRGELRTIMSEVLVREVTFK